MCVCVQRERKQESTCFWQLATPVVGINSQCRQRFRPAECAACIRVRLPHRINGRREKKQRDRDRNNDTNTFLSSSFRKSHGRRVCVKKITGDVVDGRQRQRHPLRGYIFIYLVNWKNWQGDGMGCSEMTLETSYGKSAIFEIQGYQCKKEKKKK